MNVLPHTFITQKGEQTRLKFLAGRGVYGFKTSTLGIRPVLASTAEKISTVFVSILIAAKFLDCQLVPRVKKSSNLHCANGQDFN